jgi:hypothetical protein
MQRRSFLQRVAAVGAVTCFSGKAPAARTDDKAGAKPVVLGIDGHRYECHHGWGKLPKDFVWQTTHGVTIDRQGLVYIKQQGHGGKGPIDTVMVFDAAGAFVRSFGKGIHPGGHGIDIRLEGNEEFLYLCDTAHGDIIKTNLKGEIVWKITGYPKEPGVYMPKTRYSPTNLAFAPDGGIYVADGYGSNYISQYDGSGKWVRTFGGGGSEPGKMNTPHGIWLDNRPGREPAVIVADRANARLQYFSLDGKFLSVVDKQADGSKTVLFPAHFDIRGDVLLVPDLHARVSLLDKDNKPIVHLGDDEPWRKNVLDGFKVRRDEKAWKDGRFVHPHDACFDKDGNIFVVEWVETGRVTFLKKVG